MDFPSLLALLIYAELKKLIRRKMLHVTECVHFGNLLAGIIVHVFAD